MSSNLIDSTLSSTKKQTGKSSKRPTTTGAPPIQIKMPTAELEKLDDEIRELEQTLDRKISRQKYIRAIAIYTQENKINPKKLAAALIKVI